MKLPEAVNYQFMIFPDTFYNIAAFENALRKFFTEQGLEIQTNGPLRGQGERPIMWIFAKSEDKVPTAPQGVPVKRKKPPFYA